MVKFWHEQIMYFSKNKHILNRKTAVFMIIHSLINNVSHIWFFYSNPNSFSGRKIAKKNCAQSTHTYTNFKPNWLQSGQHQVWLSVGITNWTEAASNSRQSLVIVNICFLTCKWNWFAFFYIEMQVVVFAPFY